MRGVTLRALLELLPGAHKGLVPPANLRLTLVGIPVIYALWRGRLLHTSTQGDQP